MSNAMHEYWMQTCLDDLPSCNEACSNVSSVDQLTTSIEVPIAACVVVDGVRIAAATNSPVTHHDPTAHAEILAIRRAAQVQGNYRLKGATLYVTLQPCLMCMGAIIHARVEQVVFGAHDAKKSFLEDLACNPQNFGCNHRIIWTGGILADACADKLQAFFRARR